MKSFSTLIIFFPLIISQLQAAPWGKDADLVATPAEPSSLNSRSFLSTVGEEMIRFHKTVISAADGPRSYHRPSSSQYTLDAIHKHGFLLGFLMGCDRLMRENDDPWIYSIVKDEAGDLFKWDPVK